MMMVLRFLFPLLLLLYASVTAATQPRVLDAEQEMLRSELDPLSQGAELFVGEARIASGLILLRLYERHNFSRLWTRSGAIDEITALAAAMYEHGLDPADYHHAELVRCRALLAPAAPAAARQRILLDILATDALLRMAYHIHFGKVVPRDLDPNWNFDRRIRSDDLLDTLEGLVAAPSLAEPLFTVTRKAFFYQGLKAALARYRQIAGQGGWPAIPGGPALKPGMQDRRMPLLRQRLTATGDLAQDSPPADPLRFDAELEQAVRSFQARHQLDVDGVVGRGTLQAMNVPVAARIDQIRVNLERLRWIYRELDDTFFVADIAGFHVYFVRDGRLVWDARAQVGRAFRETPVFRANMTYLEFNPTWTVPPGILRKDILPELRKDPGYLQAKRLRVLDRDGNEVDPAGIDWTAVSANGFPYLLRQDPGPDNALGRVKFMFPNKHLVYIHDTPNRNLFEKPHRAFSSGCIRIERPFELAELVLDRPQEWNRQRFEEILATGKTQTVLLHEPVPVLLLYFTVESDPAGRVRFREDLYGRDQRVLAALDGDFMFVAPDGFDRLLDDR